MARPIKTIDTKYIIKSNNEVIGAKNTLAEARQEIKSMPINDDIFLVQIVKQTTTESLIDTYETKTTKVLVATELDNDMENYKE